MEGTLIRTLIASHARFAPRVPSSLDVEVYKATDESGAEKFSAVVVNNGFKVGKSEWARSEPGMEYAEAIASALGNFKKTHKITLRIGA